MYFDKDLSKLKIPEDSFVIDIQQKITNQDELYSVYKNTITLPDYFGDNWNAFWDVLADLGWVPQKNIIIRHFVFPELSSPELKTYLEILIDSIDHWKKFDEHKVLIYFLTKNQKNIEDLLRDSTK